MFPAEGMIIVTRKGFDRQAERDEFMVVHPDGTELNWNEGRRDQEADDCSLPADYRVRC